jgi:hypothetical protein
MKRFEAPVAFAVSSLESQIFGTGSGSMGCQIEFSVISRPFPALPPGKPRFLDRRRVEEIPFTGLEARNTARVRLSPQPVLGYLGPPRHTLQSKNFIHRKLSSKKE